MRNLTTIKNLTTEEILDIMTLAEEFEQGRKQTKCKGKNLALLFFENSTRTRFSFEMAAYNLGLRIFNFDTDTSSITKGETLFDTIENLWAIGINGVVIRHNKVGIIEDTVNYGGNKTPMRFINAGDGNHAHPTQALLDFYTIRKKIGKDLKGKNVTIVGDIIHSRVAKSNIELLKRFGVNLTCAAPKYFQDDSLKDVIWMDNLQESLKGADITMCLRIQRERIEERIPFEDYIKNFQVNENNINPKTLLMHPGPANRDIEVSSVLLDSPQGRTVLEQAKNGVWIRMAVLEKLLGGEDE